MVLEAFRFAVDLLWGSKKARDLQDSPNAALVLYVVIGTIPTGLIGFLFKEPLEQLFASVNTVGVMLICTGLIVGSTRLISMTYARRQKVGIVTALAVGIAQGFAIIPGISRSGATIVCGMLFGLRGDIAARFSFILSIPAIIGALVLHLLSGGWGRTDILPLITGFIFSALVGFMALKILMGIVKKGRLAYFAPYCWALGIFILVT